MIQTTADGPATSAPCPKCAMTMVLAAVTPHPIAVHMKRHTFLCTNCNQTKTYMLRAEQTGGTLSSEKSLSTVGAVSVSDP
jgi:hypothetical protein